MKIVNRIRELRLSRGMAQTELAEKINSTPQKLSFLESGHVQISSSIDVERLSEVLDEPITRIFFIVN